MTQLIIDGREAVLPMNFACTVKRENSFFTKSGEYTYDVTLRLDNETNRELYDFLHRVNKTDGYGTNRHAELIADGHVYCRGTEVVTRWTDESVTIQIVAGESELNYFIGQDRKIETLDLGKLSVPASSSKSWPDVQFCLATVRARSGATYNIYNPTGTMIYAGQRTGDEVLPGTSLRPQPYLCEIINRLMVALGYTVSENQLEQTIFRHLFLVNTIFTKEVARMLPGWTVKDFLEEVEKLTGVVFVTDNLHKTCRILQKTLYYQNATQFTVRNVVDAYEAEVADDEGRDAEFSTSDVSYDLPDHHWTKLMKLPDGFLETAKTLDFEGIAGLMPAIAAADEQTVMRDTLTGRRYINVSRTYVMPHREEERTDKYTIEIDQFADLDREDTESTLELKITPAPMAQLGRFGCEVVDLGSTDGYRNYETSEEGDEEAADEDKCAEDSIREFAKKESEAIDLYCAFHSGHVLGNVCPVAYTDAYHASLQGILYPLSYAAGDAFVINDTASLRLQDLDSDYYQGGYQIDTRHAMTFETYDPNMIDPRQVYVILNRRFVVRDVEETITAEGRQPKWKLTCYPIHVSDDALEKRWVLTHGVWDDGAAWLDDGRWNDNRR